MLLKRILPQNVKQIIKRMLGLGSIAEKKNVDVFAKPNVDPKKVNVLIRAGGGLGDFIVYSAVIDQILEMGDLVEVYVYTLSYASADAILKGRGRVRVYYPFWVIDAEEFDLILEIDHLIQVSHISSLKLSLRANKLYKAAGKIVAYNDKFYPGTIDYYLIRRNAIMYRSKILGLNRWTQLSYKGVFDMEDMRAKVSYDSDRTSILDDYGLNGTSYITVQCGADRDLGGIRQVKVWPLKRYEEFVGLFKPVYSNIKIVQIAVKSEPSINGIDVCVKGAELEDVKVVLKNSLLLVAGEGGITHLATQLGTRCVVVFGPTPVHYYGYPTNVNIVSPACSGCMEVTEEWAKECPRGFEKPVCMGAITGQMVLDGVKEILGNEQSDIP
jgi:ADP-heptose:LPS heptosyltransferase